MCQRRLVRRLEILIIFFSMTQETQLSRTDGASAARTIVEGIYSNYYRNCRVPHLRTPVSQLAMASEPVAVLYLQLALLRISGRTVMQQWGLLLTFDIPEGNQVSPFSSVIRLTWRRLIR